MNFLKIMFLLMVLMLLFLLNTKKYFLRSLLILEGMMLSALMITIFLLGGYQFEPFLFLLLLTFGVSEAGFGLSLLLTYMKSTGSDLIKPLQF
uniref:NADH-ubiquinone oxidoreductase chain 4L n=1 Tax=Stereophaedusa callistochila TaxID=1885730 RepID=A0A224AAQ8_9EUPU|nr:NADH dehydrogenase subunit 4L [Stereophaedusa callistochila]